MVALQGDYLSVPARRILTRLRELDVPGGTDGLALLRDWDGNLAADSAAAAVFEVWYRRHLRPALLTRALGEHVGAADAVTATRISPVPGRGPSCRLPGRPRAHRDPGHTARP